MRISLRQTDDGRLNYVKISVYMAAYYHNTSIGDIVCMCLCHRICCVCYDCVRAIYAGDNINIMVVVMA